MSVMVMELELGLGSGSGLGLGTGTESRVELLFVQPLPQEALLYFLVGMARLRCTGYNMVYRVRAASRPRLRTGARVTSCQ